MGSSKQHRTAVAEICGIVQKAIVGSGPTLRLCVILLVLAVPTAMFLAVTHGRGNLLP